MRARMLITIVLALFASTAAGQRAGSAPVDTITRLSQIDGEISRALSDVEQADADGARIEAELSGIGAVRAAGSTQLAQHTRALYRLSRAGALPIAGGLDALLAHASRVERLTRMLEHDVGELHELSAREAALREETEASTTRLASARARVAALESEKLRLVTESGQLAAFDVTATGVEVPSGAGALTLGQDDGFGIRFSDGEEISGPTFESQRGELALPIAAPTAVRDATRDEGSGIELVGTRGATVRAAAAGHIAYADRHPTYGALVIVDHGHNFFTVYGGLGNIEVQVGDEAPRASRIGTVGSSAVFFQVRRGTRPLDAHGWLGL
jgi:septal ring factor EnvC (AmiA/AmiB activator)